VDLEWKFLISESPELYCYSSLVCVELKERNTEEEINDNTQNTYRYKYTEKIRAYGFGVAIKHYFTLKISYLDAYTQFSDIEYKEERTDLDVLFVPR
jgi:hypothetical protein